MPRNVLSAFKSHRCRSIQKETNLIEVFVAVWFALKKEYWAKTLKILNFIAKWRR